MRDQITGLTMTTEAQTDTTLGTESRGEEEHLQELDSRHWVALRFLRSGIQETMSAVAGGLYDLLGLSDIVGSVPGFEFAGGSAVIDLHLIAGKLHRGTSLLSRQLSTFFKLVFADGITDETCRFTEAHLTKRKLSEVTAALCDSEKIVINLNQRVSSLEAKVQMQEEVIQKLEVSRDSSELKSASLEEQMAVLFQNLADDYIYYNEEVLKRSGEAARLHEQLAPVRSAFSHSIDAVQKRLRFFQEMLSEISLEPSAQPLGQDQAGGAVQTGDSAAPGHAGKLKSLEVHLHHLTSRFSAVREGLQQTARELHGALIDKKKVVSLSVRHLKSYEILNSKLRAARAKLYDVRKSVAVFESSFRTALPCGTRANVDAEGRISHFLRCADGSDDTHSPSPTLSQLHQLLESISTDAMAVSEIVDTQDEQRQLMKTVAQSIPAVREKSAESPQDFKEKTKRVHEAVEEEKLASIRKEYSSKVAFIREVYEDRIRSLDAKVEMLVKKLVATGTASLPAPAEPPKDDAFSPPDTDLSVAAKRDWLHKKEKLLANNEADSRRDLVAAMQSKGDHSEFEQYLAEASGLPNEEIDID